MNAVLIANNGGLCTLTLKRADVGLCSYPPPHTHTQAKRCGTLEEVTDVFIPAEMVQGCVSVSNLIEL